jgi:chitinase
MWLHIELIGVQSLLALFVSCVLLTIGEATCYSCTPNGPQTESIIVAEFINWKHYSLSTFIADFNATLYTHLIFSNLDPSGAICKMSDPWGDLQESFTSTILGSDSADPYKGLLNQIRRLKLVYPHLKTIMSVGGYDHSNDLSKTAANATLRAQLTSSCTSFMQQYYFDGINLDWGNDS